MTVDRGTADAANALQYKFSTAKPPLSFPDKVDNSDAPFQPRLKIKHHAQVEWNPNGCFVTVSLRNRDGRRGRLREPLHLRDFQ